ncbi:MAG: DUF3747 domain-containing protein [Acaryochloridaceae cyanobacterium SU_2_1]|nr:DUF3747 domain-containing protein [Acaryochloridaceae cyanobacterium SU_2_1]NJM95223.1 DUF3747 domain-containing protein [Acaryochloridaceae cyanobacterium CSU_5_19]
MHNSSRYGLTALTALSISLGSCLPLLAAAELEAIDLNQAEGSQASSLHIAATFSQTSVPQDKFVAVAMPRRDNYYNLLILEQISSSKKCWQEKGSQPTEIEPLLLKFDFTGICGRNTDSNGYSIRQAGQDLGLKYRLIIEKQGDDLVLVGSPGSRQYGQPLEIGRTQGIRSGLLKIHLNPGWQFAKRTYQGKTLGHVYFTTNQTQPPPSLARRSSSSSRPSPAASSQSKSARDNRPINLPAPSTKPEPRIRSTPSSSGTNYRVIVPANNPSEQAKVKSLVPDAFRSTHGGRSVMQVGLFNSQDKADQMVSFMKRSGLRTQVLQDKVAANSPSSRSTIASRGVNIPVPKPQRASDSRLQSKAGSNSQTIYRVLVETRNTQQQTKVRSLVPDAFRSTHNGRSVMQVGLFDSQDKVERMVTLMRRNGLRTQVIRDQRSRISLQTVPGAAPGIIPVPSSVAPIGRADSGSDIYNLRAGLPPPPPGAAIALAPRYRVVVPSQNSAQTAKIKGLVPGAFRSSYQGRSVIQIGSFSSEEEARDRMRIVQRHGMNPILEKTP